MQLLPLAPDADVITWVILLGLRAACCNSQVDEVDTSGCETTKACFRVPDGCTADCDYILTWANVDHAVSFEMSASASSNNYWVSFGLSHDQKMVEIRYSIRVCASAA